MSDIRNEKDTALLQLQLQQGRASLQAAASLGQSLAASSSNAPAISPTVDPHFAAAQDRHVFRNTAKSGYIPDGPRPGAVPVPVQQATVTPVAPVQPSPAPGPREEAIAPQETNQEEAEWWKKYPALAGLDKFDFYCGVLITALLLVCIIVMATVLGIRYTSNDSSTDVTANTLSPSLMQSTLPTPVPLGSRPTPTPTTRPTATPTTAAPTVSNAPSSGPSVSTIPSSTPTSAPSSVPTLSNAPSSIPTGTPTRDLQNTINEITSLLPNSTLQTIDNNPDSPQAKAFAFVTEDWLYNSDWPSWRILQRFALVTLYYSFQENEQAASPPWLHPGTDECQWRYFGNSPCYSDTTVPSAYSNIQMRESNLKGSLPPELGFLTLLKNLDGSKTGLAGTLPTTLGQLGALETLKLYTTGIGGSIPSQIGLCTSLRWLDLSISQWESTIPSQLGLLGGLQTLFLYRNRLTGAIPSQLGNLKGLKSFDMTYNQLSGVVPQEVCAIKGPTRFDCNDSLCGCGKKYSECACPAARAGTNGTV